MQTNCGFDDGTEGKGSDLLTLLGPTLAVDIGYDKDHKEDSKYAPKSDVKGIPALVDTGALESCIDNTLAAALKLPVVDRQEIAGSVGRHTTNIYQAQIFIPSLNYTILGRFAGVDLIAGGQQHNALIGRTFLRNFHMTYEGDTGTVNLKFI